MNLLQEGNDETDSRLNREDLAGVDDNRRARSTGLKQDDAVGVNLRPKTLTVAG